MPVIDVERAFADFLEEYGAKVLDRVLSGPNRPTTADYIFHDEKIVAELKLLKINPFENKDFQKSFVKKQKEWLQKGYITASELQRMKKINELPDRCYRDIEKLYTRPIKNIIGKANDQIKNTKANFKLTDYKGLLFLGSDGNYFLEPRHIKTILDNLLASSLFYSSINTVVYFTVNMVTTRPDDPTISRLWVNLYRDKEKFESVPVSFLNDLFDKWATYFNEITGMNLKKINEMNEQGITERDVLQDTRFLKFG